MVKKIKNISDEDLEVGDVVEVKNFEGNEKLLFEAIPSENWDCKNCIFGRRYENVPDYFKKVCSSNRIYCQNRRSRSKYKYGLNFKIYQGI